MNGIPSLTQPLAAAPWRMIVRPRRARLLQLVCRRCRVRPHAAPMLGL
jgi:hypothetical protein